jgi:hypothetical protein
VVQRTKSFACIVMVIISLFVSVLTPPAIFAAAPIPGDQVMPISMKGYYVLFPGERAPFLKSGKLMVPIRTFTDVIGAHLLYKPQTKRATVLLLGRSVANIKHGELSAIFDGDMGFSLGAEPELRNGRLFVPATPILSELKYTWGVFSDVLDNLILGINDGESWDVLLSGMDPPMKITPFPAESTIHPYPFYPSKLTQNRSGEEYQLTLSLQNTSGSYISKGSSEMELIFVDSQNKTTVRTLQGPEADVPKGGKLSFDVSIPTVAEYVLFRSRTVQQ